MKKYLLILLVVLCLAGSLFLLNTYQKRISYLPEQTREEGRNISIDEGLELLRIRHDQQALVIFQQSLKQDPKDLLALWGKAEVLRRKRDFQESEEILNEILLKDNFFIPALISLSYIRYNDGKLDQAEDLLNQILKHGCRDKNNLALVYMMLGSINSKRSKRGWLISKIKYGTQIKSNFLKAQELAPDLPEVHLGLGTFYLLAPSLFGGNLEEAIKELELAEKIAPEFATVKARLAQAYKKHGQQEKYNYYLNQVKELDPENEVLEELGD
ncbi:MAG: tetratricopeptide repeat protein [Candidatus Omnitrophota bacterium]